MAAIWGILSHNEPQMQTELPVLMKKRMRKYIFQIMIGLNQVL